MEGEEEPCEHERYEKEINFVGNLRNKGMKRKGKGRCWTCGEEGHRAAECPKGGGKGKGGDWFGKNGGYKGDGFGKGGGKMGKGDGKGGKGGWLSQATRAFFGCGSTTHLFRDCPNNPNKATQQVQEVRNESEGREVLFIGHTSATEDDEPWE